MEKSQLSQLQTSLVKFWYKQMDSITPERISKISNKPSQSKEGNTWNIPSVINYAMNLISAR